MHPLQLREVDEGMIWEFLPPWRMLPAIESRTKNDARTRRTSWPLDNAIHT